MIPLCRLSVFVPRRIGRRVVTVAWQDWNDDRRMEWRMARLPGSGSFYYRTPRAACRRARVLIDRGASAVRVETISGREVTYLYGRTEVA